MVDHFPLDLQKGLIPDHIQTIGELDEFEETNIADGLIWLGHYSGKDYLNHDFWIKLHKKLFGNVWSWAGEVRSHELNNPDFLKPFYIWLAFKQLEEDLKYWLENDTFEEREFAAILHERIETIHPFNNGNGRFGRILTEFICKREKMQIPTWGTALNNISSDRRKKYIASLVKARKDSDYKDLINFMFS